MEKNWGDTPSATLNMHVCCLPPPPGIMSRVVMMRMSKNHKMQSYIAWISYGEVTPKFDSLLQMKFLRNLGICDHPCCTGQYWLLSENQ